MAGVDLTMIEGIEENTALVILRACLKSLRGLCRMEI
jgi:hypothetical protein